MNTNNSYPSATGMTCVTPSPESITVPVRERLETFENCTDKIENWEYSSEFKCVRVEL